MILSSCLQIDKNMSSLYVQKVHDSNNVIYKYTYHGMFDSHTFGTVLLDSAADFTNKNRYQITTGLITKIDSNNVIEAIDLYYYENYNEESDSIKTETKRINDFILNISHYHSGWGVNKKYYFDELKESKYELTFYGVEYDPGKYLSDPIMSFHKGGIWIRDTDGIVEYFELFRLISRRRDDSNTLQFGRANYKFYPKDTLHVDELSDYGFFKRIIESRF